MVLELDTGRCASEDASPQGKWILGSHIGWRGERNIPYKGENLFLVNTFQNREANIDI